MALDQLADLSNNNEEVGDLNEEIKIEEPPNEEVIEEGEGETGKETQEETEEEEFSPEVEEEDFSVPPRRKEILAKYPNLMKDFPYIERALYREKEYSQIFPSIDDAREASEKLTTFETYEEDLNKGSFESLLKNLKESNQEGFSRSVNSYLENLSKVDNEAYLHVISNVYKTGIRNMLVEAQRTQNKELQDMAFSLNEFLFGTPRWTPPAKYGNASNPEVDEVKKEREQFAQERLQTKQSDVMNAVDKTTRHNIDINIDPKNQMTPFAKKAAAKEALNLVNEQIKSDVVFQKQIAKMWKDAESSKFSEEKTRAIRNAIISRAKSILPQAIRKVRSEALAGSRERGNGDAGPIRGGKPRGASNSNSSTNNSGNNNSGKLKIPEGVKPHDWLMQD